MRVETFNFRLLDKLGIIRFKVPLLAGKPLKPMKDIKYIKLKEFAEKIGVSLRTAQKWQTERIIIPSIKIGRISMYDFEETVERLKELTGNRVNG